MDFNARRKELINQVNFAKAEMQDIETQVDKLEKVRQTTENKIISLLGALALCDEFIESQMQENAEIKDKLAPTKVIEIPETQEETEEKLKV